MATTTIQPQWRRSRRHRTIAVGLGATGATLGLAAFIGPPSLLMNTSPSEPPGVYARTTEAPAVGRIIAFPLPAAGAAYAERAMPFLRHRPLLKAVAAGPGDEVCAGQGSLTINGRRQAPVAERDHLGRPLPHWQGCRRLGPGELFVYSARVPNSFDSRYYGPVPRDAVLGVYRLVAPIGAGAA